MRALVMVIALTLMCAGFALADDASSVGAGAAAGVCPPNTMNAASGTELADACVANSLGLTKMQVRDLRVQGLTYSDIATAQAIATKASKPLNDVVTAWQANKSWPDVATQFNVSMSDIANMPLVGNADSEAFNTAFVAHYYGIQASSITMLRKDGFSWDDIYMIANAAARTGQPVATIAQLRQQSMSWTDIAAKFNVPCADLTKPVASRRIATVPVVGAGPGCETPSCTAPPCPLPCCATPKSVPCPPIVLYNEPGNILLTQDVAVYLYSMGYDWIDVAIAANVANATNLPIKTLLDWVRAGTTWSTIVDKYNVPYGTAFNVANYPYERKSVYSTKTECCRLGIIQGFQQSGGKLASWPSMTQPMLMIADHQNAY